MYTYDHAKLNYASPSIGVGRNDANLSQGESERSERSQIEDVTNYCSNVAQGFKEMGGMLR